MKSSGINVWCDRIITFSFYSLFALVPLLLTPWNYELFEYNKMMAVYGLTVIITASWIAKMIAQKEIRITRTPLDISIALFVTSQLVSSIFSIDPHISWLGYYSRFNGGMFSIISYIFLYYAFVSNIPSTIPQLLRVTLLSATLVAVYGVLERLGIDKHIWVQDVQNRVFSTLGQPNWLAAYLVAIVPITLAFGLKNTFYWILSILFFITLLFTRSRSGLIGFAVADVIFWGIILLNFARPSLAETLSTSSRGKGRAFFALHILFALIIFINGTGTPTLDRYITLDGWKNFSAKKTEVKPVTSAGPALEVGGTESGTIRKYVWEGAISAWKSTTKTFLIGTGTETFTFAFYQFRPAGHNQTSEWDFLYNKAHNEYLNYLATTGIFGLGSYVFFIGWFIFWYIKNLKKDIITIALFSGWISILITNFFGFSVVIVQVFLFLFPAIIISTASKQKIRSIQLKLPTWTIWIILITGTLLVYKIASFWYADTLFAQGYRSSRSGLVDQATKLITQATMLNQDEPVYHDELSGNYATLAVAAFQNKNATEAANLSDVALKESAIALSISPKNVNFWKTRTKVYYTLSSLDPALNGSAIEALKQAATLSPNDPKIYYNIAILAGRSGDTQSAVSYLLKAKQLKPNYRDAYFALHVFYTETKKTLEAKKILQEYLTKIDPKDEDFIQRIK